jgi:toxin ParE1/3/4
MRGYRVRLTDEAEADLVEIYRFVLEISASKPVARQYIDRIRAFLEGFATFPQRGSIRDDIREGLRIIGFERRVSIAFVVEEEDVVILRILSAGQKFNANPG